jgi:hypothetical protein
LKLSPDNKKKKTKVKLIGYRYKEHKQTKQNKNQQRFILQ